jgi:hypothetical protein
MIHSKMTRFKLVLRVSRVKRGRQIVGDGEKVRNATRETAKEEPSGR